MAYKSRYKYITMALRRVGTDDYGIDYIAAGAPAITLQTSDANIDPMEGDELERNLDDGNDGSSQVMLDGHKVKLTFKIEITGSGTVDLLAPYAPLHEVTGRRSEINAGVDVVTTRVIDGSELDATFYYYKDGALHKALGCRGSRKVIIKSGELPYYEYEVTGIYGGVVTNSFNKPTFVGYQKPHKVGKTSSLLLDGDPRELIEIEFNDGNSVEHFEYSTEKMEISEYKPDGSLTIEMPPLADFDPFAIADAETLMTVEVTLGKTIGNIVKIGSNKIQLLRPSYEDVKGITGYKLPFKLIEDVTDTTL